MSYKLHSRQHRVSAKIHALCLYSSVSSGTSEERVFFSSAISDSNDFKILSAGGGKKGSKTIKIASDVRKKYGIESAAHLPCINLSEKDADGIHLYTMNNPYVARKIYEAVYRLLAVKC